MNPRFENTFSKLEPSKLTKEGLSALMSIDTRVHSPGRTGWNSTATAPGKGAPLLFAAKRTKKVAGPAMSCRISNERFVTPSAIQFPKKLPSDASVPGKNPVLPRKTTLNPPSSANSNPVCAEM